MNKEREFIRLWYENIELWKVHAKELLAQPEPFTPDWVNYRQGVEDSKRKPLSDDAIQQIINTKHFDTRYILQQSYKRNLRWYKQGVKDAEKAHGIGGGE